MRARILRIFFVLEAVVYITAVSFSFALDLRSKNVWFSLFILLIGFHELMKFILFRADSFLWGGGIFTFIGIIGILRYVMNIDAIMIFPWYIFSVGCSSFITFVVFRQFIHLKIFIVIGIEVVILLMFCYNIIAIEPMLVINIIYLTAVLIEIYFRLRRNMKSKE